MEVLKSPIGMNMVEKMNRIWNEIEMLIMGEVITTSGYAEVILEVLKSPIGMSMVEKMFRNWNQVEMSINDEIITTSGFV